MLLTPCSARNTTVPGKSAVIPGNSRSRIWNPSRPSLPGRSGLVSKRAPALKPALRLATSAISQNVTTTRRCVYDQSAARDSMINSPRQRQEKRALSRTRSCRRPRPARLASGGRAMKRRPPHLVANGLSTDGHFVTCDGRFATNGGCGRWCVRVPSAATDPAQANTDLGLGDIDPPVIAG